MRELDLPKQYQPQPTEAKWQAFWEESGVFIANRDSDRPVFSVMIPPPNVTGSLHMGHAFEQAIIDTLVRWRRMCGFNTLWLPGTDHASIAVQTLLEKELKKEGKTRFDLGREKFLERAWQWKEESGGTIVRQMRRLGVSVDWSRERFTMDDLLSRTVTEAFVRLYESGLIYRGEYLVNWCPASQSAVSDLEVENVEVQGHLWHLRYPLADGSGYLVVATTRPETMLGDTAVAVNPRDDRYSHLLGKMVRLPLVERLIPIIGDEYVDQEFGSGCVKVTPAHDPNDFEMGKRHHLPMINILNKDGSINEQGGRFAGLDRFTARKEVVSAFAELGLLEKVEDYKHTVPYSDRGKVPIEPFLSVQWFVKITPLAEAALKAFDEENAPQFVPERWGKVYRDWLAKLKDWCISRQLWWGHQIPAWYTPTGEIIVARTEAEAYQKGRQKFGAGITLERDQDVLDTWFSSGLWCFSTLGWLENHPDYYKFYPTSVLVTGFDIIFFWVARMTMLSKYFTDAIPFHTVYIHGLVRDENNQKMSKSKNNGIDPLILIEKYGTDALRYALIREVIGAGQDIRLDYNRKTDESSTVESARNFATKLWNASRFVFMNLTDWGIPVDVPLETLELSDRWILSRYHRTVQEVNDYLGKYGFGESAKLLYEFIWGDFCDWYIELVKSRLGADSPSCRSAQWSLATVLNGILHLLHPFMPHITEELWQTLHRGHSDPVLPVLACQPYPQADPQWISAELETQFTLLIGVIRSIRNLRVEAEIKPSQKVRVLLHSEDGQELALLRSGAQYVLDLAKVEELEIASPYELKETAIAGVVGTVQVILPLSGLIDLGQFKVKLEKNIAKLATQIETLSSRLNNPTYREKAKPEAIAATEQELKEAEQQFQLLQARYSQLAG
ncbi:MAG: valine--tRNA ligase [Pseudanabaenaceae cyanobacterium]